MKRLANIPPTFWLLLVFIALGVFIRSLHFVDSLNFSYDQGFFSRNALTLWREKKIVLIGPTASLNFDGRYTYQGSAVYYFLLLMLLISGFQPVLASYLFMLFSMAMIVPLFIGMQWLVNKKAAIVFTSFYAFFPLMVNYTKFLWNPTFQLALAPVLVLLMGCFQKTKKAYWLLLIGIWAGFLLQFHFQFVLVIAGLFLYYLLVKRVVFPHLPLFIVGLMIGFFPLILFGLKHDFYNLNTVLLLLSHHQQVGAKFTSFAEVPPHYYLSLSLFLLVGVLVCLRRLLTPVVVGAIFCGLFLFALVSYLPKPSRAFGMVEHWTASDDERVYADIREANVKNFNVVNLAYDTLAVVQKFYLDRDRVDVGHDLDDYYLNHYLFVVSHDGNYLQNPAYEVNTFQPSHVVKTWEINSYYRLYLLERDKR